MNIKQLGLSLFISLVLAAISGEVLAKKPPVAKLVQIEGSVEYSRDGKKWKPVRRTKYLFSGTHIRTGDDGGGKLISQSTGKSQVLGNSTKIQIDEGNIVVVSGSLSEPEDEETSLFQSVTNKFAKAQRYTTVRRSVDKGGEEACDSKVRTIREVTVSQTHADLVWRNACPEYSYKLVINDADEFSVPAQSTSEMIRFSVADMSPGDHSYRVEVIDVDGTVYIPKKDSRFTLLTAEEEKAIKAELEKVGDDIFLETTVLEENGMYVAAMDAYRAYFQEFPDENDMRPMLIQSYQELKLSNLRESEADRKSVV